jgi:peptidoglycan/LPS O-acetylase OafA/YrhL
LWFYGANIFIGWHGDWGLGCLNHFWSLAVEEHFYLFWPLVIFCTSRKTALWICGAMILCTPLARAAWLVAGGNGIAVEVFTPFRLDALAVGAWLSLMIRSPGGEAKLMRWAAPVALMAGLALLPLSFPERRLLGLPLTLFAIFFGAMLILALKTGSGNSLVSTGWNRLCNLRALRFFGKFSYGMYVFQNLLIPVCALWFTAASLTAATGSAALGHGLYVALMFGATMLVSLFSWHFFEKHFLGLKKYFERAASIPAVSAEKVSGGTLA